MNIASHSALGGFKPAIIDELENQIGKERGIPVQNSSSDLEVFSKSKCFLHMNGFLI